MKRLIVLLAAAIMAFTALNVVSSAAYSKITADLSYGNGYTYVTLGGSGTLYYTTDGSKPTQSSEKYTGKLKITSPCKLRIASYVGGEKVSAAYKTIAVKVKAPTAVLQSNDGSSAVYKISAPSGAKVYMTTDGSTPSAKNGTLVSNGKITIYESCTVKLVSIKSGWKSSMIRKIEVSVAFTSETYAEEVARLINEQREAYGLPALEIDDTLMEAAEIRAEELITVYSHTRPDGTACSTVVDEPYYHFGENIAAGYKTPEEVVNGWMNSEGHRANILNESFTKFGVGYAYGNSGHKYYWTQIFLG